MITRDAGTFCIDWARYNDAWIVYEHWLCPDPLNPATSERIYVGVCRMREIGVWPDAQRNSEWGQRIIAQPTNRLTCSVVATCDDKTEAMNERQRYVAALPHRPICNLRGFTTHGTQTPVVCNETGLEYSSAAEAARSIGVTQPMMSAHLNNKPGFGKVRGLTFTRRV